MSIGDFSNHRLVTLRPGNYWRVETKDDNSPTNVQLNEPTNALLIEFQGCHASTGRSTKLAGDECWHALVNGEVILVWESSFKNKGTL